jgi:hypothetical protein
VDDRQANAASVKQVMPVQSAAQQVQLELRLLLELQPLQVLGLGAVPAVDVPLCAAGER